MTKPQYQYQVHTIDDLMYYGFKIMVDAELVSIYDLGNDKVIRKKRRKCVRLLPEFASDFIVH